MHRDLVPCLACDAEVRRGTRVCPACDYDVGRHDRRRPWLGALGTALTLSVVLAPLGLPLLWLAHQHRLAAAGSVARRADVPLGEHLVIVLRGFLSVERRPIPPSDFYRGGGNRAAGHPRSIGVKRGPYR